MADPFKNKVTLGTCLIALLTVGLACDGTSRIDGKVVNEDGIPISGARVILKSTPSDREEEVTVADGSFHMFLIHAPFDVELTIQVSKQGYRDFEKNITSTEARELEDSNKHLIVTLEKE